MPITTVNTHHLRKNCEGILFVIQLGLKIIFSICLTLIEGGLSNVCSKCLSNWVAELAATVDHHLHDEAEVCHFFNCFSFKLKLTKNI